jgi:hypothetical protein
MDYYNFYPRAETFNLRDEFHQLLFGNFEDPGIGRPVLVRRIRDQKCVCFKSSTGSPNPGCRYCDGEGYLWDETLETAYVGKNVGSVLGAATGVAEQNSLATWGESDDTRSLAYFEASVFPNYERYLIPQHPTCDRLFELKVDHRGELITPAIRVAKWKIKSLTPHQGDFGRVEFFEAGLEGETV